MKALSILAVGLCATGLAIFLVNQRAAKQPPRLALVAENREREAENSGAADSAAWHEIFLKDDFGNISKDGYQSAMLQRQRNIAHWDGIRTPGSNPWQSLGPSNFPGRLLSMAISPSDSNVLLAGTAGGGLWRSTDRGKNWTPLSDRWRSLSIGALAFDPRVSSVVYAGTGEGNRAGNAVSGAGIYKSQDGGATWSFITGSKDLTNINSLAVSPTNSSVLLVTQQPGSIMRSTDGGATWTKTLPDSATVSVIAGFEVQFSPQNGSNAIATAEVYDRSINNYAWSTYYSTNGGASWNLASGNPSSIPGYLARLTVRYAPSDPSTVYLTANTTNTSQGQFFKSTDGGQSYFNVGSYPIGNSQGWFNNPLWVDPTNPNVILSGGMDAYRSTDGGSSWTVISDWFENRTNANNPHADHHFVLSDPAFDGRTNTRVYVCTDGSLFSTENIYTASRTGGWTNVGKGTVSAQFYSAAGHGPTGKVVGGAQDNGTLALLPNNQNATAIGLGDGTNVAIDPTDANIVYLAQPYLTIQRATSSADLPTPPLIVTGLKDAFGNSNFVAPFILSPSNSSVMWAGGKSLWRSTNVRSAAPNWSEVKPAGRTFISAIAEAPKNSSVVWIGDNNGSIYATSNATAGTPTWKTISDQQTTTKPLPGRAVSRIFIDPDNANTVYVAFGGYPARESRQPDNLYRTIDGGTTWAKLTGTGATALPQAPIYGIARNPQLPKSLYVATEVGVFSSADSGATWSTSDAGPANAHCYDLNFIPGTQKLLVATNGRGIWSAVMPGSQVTSNLSAISLTSTAIPGGNALTGKITLTANAPTGGKSITLKTSDPIVTGATVTVAAGSNNASFSLTTKGVDAAKAVGITAVDGSINKVAQATINPPLKVTSFTTNTPLSVFAGDSVKVVLTLDALAGPSGFKVPIAGDAEFVPQTFTMPAGTRTATITVGTQAVKLGASVQATSTATIAGLAYKNSNQVTVKPGLIESLSVAPSTVVGGNSVVATVKFTGNMAPGSKYYPTVSDPKLLTVPDGVAVPTQARSVTFNITTAKVTSQKTATVTVGGVTSGNFTATITLTPPVASTVASIIPNLTTVKGGQALSITVNLTAAAGTAGLTVDLVSSDLSIPLPKNLIFKSGVSKTTFTVTTKAVSKNTAVRLDAKSGTVTKSANVTVTP